MRIDETNKLEINDSDELEEVSSEDSEMTEEDEHVA